MNGPVRHENGRLRFWAWSLFYAQPLAWRTIVSMVGEMLSHYRILEQIGSGGMGDVYRAEDLQLGRTVALKVVRDPADADSRSRLLAEARAASALNHPNIAVVYEASEVELDSRPLAYIAMEYVDGTTLTRLAGG